MIRMLLQRVLTVPCLDGTISLPSFCQHAMAWRLSFGLFSNVCESLCAIGTQNVRVTTPREVPKSKVLNGYNYSEKSALTREIKFLTK